MIPMWRDTGIAVGGGDKKFGDFFCMVILYTNLKRYIVLKLLNWNKNITLIKPTSRPAFLP